MIPYSPLREKALSLYLKGYTDADVARLLKCSRERVRQFRVGLKLSPPFPERPWISVAAASRITKVSGNTIFKWIRAGLLHRSPSWLIRPEDILEVKAWLMGRPCAICGAPVNTYREGATWCPEHNYKWQDDHKWEFMTPEQKLAHNKAMEEAEAKDPVRYRLYQKRGQLAYQLRRKGLSPGEYKAIVESRFPMEHIRKRA